ncbi:MAG: AAA family ATPase [Pyrinomonadaceae bacterium]
MHITKVELENIKSHAHEIFSFERGTTAITGANGAGKTTIIEAVAWTLFDLLDYKKDDFAKRGAKGKGVARVVFESSLDEREYLVYRDTANGYYVYDPQLKAKIADKKEEVTRFLRQHLGVEAGTDLESLFRRAIGVPQGTFTAIFLESATERKKAFDKLLKVEEYRQGAEKLRETARYIETKINMMNIKIGRAEGELSRLDAVEADYKNFSGQIATLSASLENLNRETTEKKKIVKRFDETETQINELKTRRDKLQSDLATAEVVLKQKEAEKNQSQISAAKIKTVEADYQIYLSALARLTELERERIERDKLNTKKTTVETAQINVKADRRKFQENLENALKAHQEIELLEPKVAEQEELEKQLGILKTRLAEEKNAERELKILNPEIGEQLERYKKNKTDIAKAESAAESAANVKMLGETETRLTNKLAELKAKLESDRKFQSEIRNGLCPILSEKCLNLKQGQTLEGFVKNQFGEIAGQISVLETNKKQNAELLENAREAEKAAAVLEKLREHEKTVVDEGKRLRERQTGYKILADNLAKTQSEINETETKLKTLGSPRELLKIKQAEAEHAPRIREKLSEVEKNLERLESDRRIFTDQLEVYKDLDANYALVSAERNRTATAHREFLSHETTAKFLPEREKEFEKAALKLANLKTEFEKAAAEFETASKDYDRQRHLSEKVLLLDAEKRLAETKARFEETQRRKSELENELKRLTEIRAAMQLEFAEKDKLEKVAETTDFIRETLKEAAPRVARNYVHYVSLEANQMFREISGNAERTLKWTEDYGIVLEENGHERPFINLSGGEQMAAALSVRLALLMQLSDIRIAFFDEPTTNMDAERRENLAEQISRITKKQVAGKPIFDQLFVISHDDTFVDYVDYEVSIGDKTEAAT